MFSCHPNNRKLSHFKERSQPWYFIIICSVHISTVLEGTELGAAQATKGWVRWPVLNGNDRSRATEEPSGEKDTCKALATLSLEL